jgi:predicted membrane protein
MFDAGTSVLPLRFAESRWRYGSIGLLSNSLLIPMAGALIVFAIANASNHVRTLRVLGVIAGLSCALCLAAIGTFTLDAIQSQRDINPALRLPYVVGTATAFVKLCIGAIAFGFFALAGFKRSATGRPEKRDQVLVGKLEPTRPKSKAAPV